MVGILNSTSRHSVFAGVTYRPVKWCVCNPQNFIKETVIMQFPSKIWHATGKRTNRFGESCQTSVHPQPPAHPQTLHTLNHHFLKHCFKFRTSMSYKRCWYALLGYIIWIIIPCLHTKLNKVIHTNHILPPYLIWLAEYWFTNHKFSSLKGINSGVREKI
jgi:hypothetical protein